MVQRASKKPVPGGGRPEASKEPSRAARLSGEGDQAGVVPFRLRPDGHVQILLVTSRSGPWWIVPKGNVDEGSTPREAAAREAFEEAGLLGTTLPRQIGSYEYPKLGRPRRVSLFAMRVHRVLRRWPEMDERKREWVSIDEAIRRVPYLSLRDVLAEFESFGPGAHV